MSKGSTSKRLIFFAFEHYTFSFNFSQGTGTIRIQDGKKFRKKFFS